MCDKNFNVPAMDGEAVTASLKRDLVRVVDGFHQPRSFPEKSMMQATSFRPKAGDIVVASFPKCGTHWIKYIIHNVLRRGDCEEVNQKFFDDDGFIFIDMNGTDELEDAKSPRFVMTHLPYHILGRHLQAKYIYTARNPFDVCVSYFHFLKQRTHNPALVRMTFDEHFELFVRGENAYGDIFDHVLGWHRHRHDPGILFLTYEDLTSDTETQVLRIADFLGEEHGQALRRDTDLLNRILENISFSKMKANLSLFTEQEGERESPFADVTGMRNNRSIREHFFRKGTVGDWVNHFTDDQRTRMARRMEEKLCGTEAENLWPSLNLTVGD